MGSSRVARAVVGAGVIITTMMIRATAAVAQSYPGGGETPPQVAGKRFFRGEEDTANTGLAILLLILLALLALLIGMILRSMSRRRKAVSVVE
jgi:hypothetical protein